MEGVIDHVGNVECEDWKLFAAKTIIKEGYMTPNTNLALVYNVTRFRRTVENCISSFPSHFFHTLAGKANPLTYFVSLCKELGIGFEAASMGEVQGALNSGMDSSRVIFDSPAKTTDELEFSLRKGVYINIDNFQELERVKKLVSQLKNESLSGIGIRINPQVGAGANSDTSTATMTSKFGIPLEEKEKLISAYIENKFLIGIHVHVGSQGCPLELIAEGIRKTYEVAEEINKRIGHQQINVIDIGGGLPTNFSNELDTPSFQVWAQVLKNKIPGLFDSDCKYKVITEFGRALSAKCGIHISRVEYTKMMGGRNIVTQHLGADLAIRTVYHPHKWPLRITVVDENGVFVSSDSSNDSNERKICEQDIAGPCCFTGDVIAHRRKLPQIIPGDLLLIHDTGAYYYSSYSHYNSRNPPLVLAFSEESPQKIKLIRKSSIHDALNLFDCKS